MTEEEWKRRANAIRRTGPIIMKNDLPAPVTQRLEWLEADASAQRTAILRLEREVKFLFCFAYLSAPALGFLIQRMFP